MALLGGIEMQRFAQRRQHFRRGADVAALLEPRVPGDADAGEQRHLIAPQARSAASKAIRQAGRGRRQPLAPRAQEGAKFASTGDGGDFHDTHADQHSRIDTRINSKLFAGLAPGQSVARGAQFTAPS